jgi:N12 class adenine-specific DNA methylase
LAYDEVNGALARKSLNKTYDEFVKEFGPVNLAKFTYRRPSAVQAEAARNQAREEAADRGDMFDEGSFDPTQMINDGTNNTAIAKARTVARDGFVGKWSDGDFSPDTMPDVITDRRPNISGFGLDPESYRLRAIEKYDEITGIATKGKVFTESQIAKEQQPSINSVNDALLFVLNKFGKVDMPEIARAAGIEESEAIEQLGENIYQLPGTENTWTTKEEYLSGNVRKKLRVAQAAAEANPNLRRNVDALKKAQPAPLPATDITATLGMNWIPTSMIDEFMTDGLGLRFGRVQYTPSISLWTVEGDKDSVTAVSTWGTERRHATDLMKDVLNKTPPKIFMKDADNKSVIDPTATQAANDKILEIRERFKEWIWDNPERANTLTGIYNEKFNSIALREYNGDYLTTPGIVDHWSWRPHQSAVVSRIIQNGNTYMAHSVGSGKTSAMIGAGMEMRRLGLVKKPMYAVPNHMLAQFTAEFYEQYPLAKIAVADEQNFHTNRRKQFIANAANEDLDAVIITHSSFGKLPVSGEFQDNLVQDQVQAFRDVIAEIEAVEGVQTDRNGKKKPSITVKKIENSIEKLEQRLSGNRNNTADQVYTFQEMGVDFLFVDEAHEFRKLDFATKQNLKGIDPNGSKKAWDLFVKTRYLESINPGRNLVLASGTPITNTMGELYTVQRYLQYSLLAENNLLNFDDWSGAYGDTSTTTEQNPAGGYQSVTRFANFVNSADLSKMVRQNMDVVTSKQLEQYVVRPELEGGKPQLVIAKRSKEQKDYQQVLADRMEAIANRGRPPEKGDDILLSVINDGRLSAIDMRFVNPDLPSDPNSKLNLMIANVHDIWKKTKMHTFYKPGTDEVIDKGPAAQMIFANLGVNKKNGFGGYAWMVKDLVARGVPRNQIAIIGDYKSHSAKQALFKKVNKGEIRILIGSSAKMGTGVNAQQRLVAVHNQDPLWYPADDEQRNGRILRQGNFNKNIQIKNYTTEGTYDAVMWSLMGKKARFIQDFFEGDPNLREMEDLGAASLYEQANALSTADNRVIKLQEKRQDLEKLHRREKAHLRNQANINYQLNEAKKETRIADKATARIAKDIEQRQDTKGRKFKMQVGNKTITKRIDAGAALIGQAELIAESGREVSGVSVGSFAGFPITVSGQKKRYYGETVFETSISIERNGGQWSEFDLNGFLGAKGLIQSMEKAVAGFENDTDWYKRRKADAERTIADFAPKQGVPFKGKAEIDKLAQEVDRLDAAILAGPEGEDAPRQDNYVKTVKPEKTHHWRNDNDTPHFSTLPKNATKKPRGISIRELNNVVKEFEREFATGIRAHGISIHTKKFAPEELRRNAEAEGLDPDHIKGAYYPTTKRVLLIAGNLNSKTSARRTITHELLAHHGLNLLTPVEKKAFLNRIIHSKNRPFIKTTWNLVAEQSEYNDDHRIAEEVFAYTVDNTAHDESTPLWDRILLAMIRAFRKVGFLKGAVTKAEMREFAKDLATGIRHGFRQSNFPKSDAAQFSLMRDTISSAKNLNMDAVKIYIDDKLVNARPKVLGLFGRRQLVDMYGKIFPGGGMERYNQFNQDMDAKANTMAADADALAKEWLKLPVKMRDLLAEVMNLATIHEVDPSSLMPLNKDELADLKTKADGARASFNKKHGKFPSKQSFLDSKYNKVKTWRIYKREEARHTEGEKVINLYNRLDAASKLMYSKVKDQYTKTQTEMDKALEQQIQDSDATPETKVDQLRSLRQYYERPKERGPYFPLTRFGNFTVSAKDAEGKTYFEKFETRQKQRKFVEDITKDGYTNIKEGVSGEFTKEEREASPDFVKQMLRIIEPSSMDRLTKSQAKQRERMKDSIWQHFLTTQPAMSVRKHYIHRKKTPGYSSDVIRGFAKQQFHSARQISRTLYGQKMQAELDIMKESYLGFKLDINKETNKTEKVDLAPGMVVADKDRVAAGQVLEEMNDRHQLVMNPPGAGWVNFAGGLGFVWYLGLTPAAALVNISQTPLVAYPLLGAKYGFDATAIELMRATNDYRKSDFKLTEGGYSLTRNSKLPNNEKLGLAQMVSEGVIDLTQAHDLAGLGDDMGQDANRDKWRKAMKVVSWGFHSAEVLNREVTWLAAYRLAVADGTLHHDAINVARDMVYKGHFDYSSNNRPKYMRGNVARVLTMFKQYSQNMIYTLGRSMQQALKGEDPEVRRIAKRQFGGLMLMHGVAAGTLGLPMVTSIMWVVTQLAGVFGDDDEPWDAEVEFRNFLADNIGSKGGEMASHGLLRGVLPIDVAHRVGLESLLFRGPNRELEGHDLYSYWLEQAVGPIGGIAASTLEGAKLASDGHLDRAFEKWTPKALRDVMKAGRYASEGVRTIRGDALLSEDDRTYAELISQLVGFTPARVSERYEANNAVMNTRKFVQKRRQTIMDDYYKAWKDSDKKALEEAKRKLMAFNRKHPRSAISNSGLRSSIKRREYNRATAKDGLVLPVKHDNVREYGRFAG